MSAPTPRESIAEIIRRRFPWLARVGIGASGALEVRAASGRIELEGGGAAVGRVGDLVVRLVQDSLTGVLYVSTDDAAPRTWAPVASVVGVPLASTAGTRVAIFAGSKKVTCG